MGNQGSNVKPSSSGSSYNNQYYSKPTQQDINKNTLNVMKGYTNQNSFNSQNRPGTSFVPQSQGITRSLSLVPRPKYTITSKMLKETFKTYAIDGQYLNKDRFDDAIESIFRFPEFPEMHYTYLSEKIYYLIDDSGDGKIQDDEFVSGLSNVLSDRGFRNKLSMMAMMSIPDQNRNYIEPSEIQEFFYKSWVQGYRHLGWQINRNKTDFISRQFPTPTIKQLELWAEKYENQVRFNIENDLKENGINVSQPIDIETFKKWLYKDHSIYIQYGHKKISIATSLIKLDEVKFEDDGAPVGGAVPNSSQSGMNNSQGQSPSSYYPSF